MAWILFINLFNFCFLFHFDSRFSFAPLVSLAEFYCHSYLLVCPCAPETETVVECVCVCLVQAKKQC